MRFDFPSLSLPKCFPILVDLPNNQRRRDSETDGGQTQRTGTEQRNKEPAKRRRVTDTLLTHPRGLPRGPNPHPQRRLSQCEQSAGPQLSVRTRRWCEKAESAGRGKRRRRPQTGGQQLLWRMKSPVSIRPGDLPQKVMSPTSTKIEASLCKKQKS